MWIILRDFNEVRGKKDMLNSNFNYRGAMEFNNFIYRASLKEYNMSGMKFTYASQDGSKFSKIDRVRVCDHFFQKWPSATLLAHPRKWSDHSPLTLSLLDRNFGPKPFKFFSSWMYKPKVKNVIENALEDVSSTGPPDLILLDKLKRIKWGLKSWWTFQKDSEHSQVNELNLECNHFETLAELGILLCLEEAWILGDGLDLRMAIIAPNHSD
ncbi:hypothetical protein E3N88_26443 [Mikania micrantha]|uniref:Endonuclease/exonuclease/phosphatase domain-containing protein n=1 Tax=Mikania micrantha TaxID=192012 RepID=A0A5N6N7P3_9ASTR|nr:hypothetical protein E3N88_26443 [Mikania micrantha]